MSSGKQAFQTAVAKTPSRGEREEAIDRLVDAGECDKLAVLVQMSGLDGPLRRRALDGMPEAGCGDLLRTVVENDGIEEPLESDAEDLLAE